MPPGGGARTHQKAGGRGSQGPDRRCGEPGSPRGGVVPGNKRLTVTLAPETKMKTVPGTAAATSLRNSHTHSPTRVCLVPGRGSEGSLEPVRGR